LPEIKVRVLFGLTIWLELPAEVVAKTVDEPAAVGAMDKVIVAEVPSGLTTTFEAVIAAGTKAGKKENVDPVRLKPVT
jgi:hypothetical protein